MSYVIYKPGEGYFVGIITDEKIAQHYCDELNKREIESCSQRIRKLTKTMGEEKAKKVVKPVVCRVVEVNQQGVRG